VGARQPWLERRFAEARNHGERGGGDCEEEDEKWRRRDKWLGLIAGSLFNSGSGEGHVTVHWIAPKIMDRRPDLP
jgi:hypothetical protein